MKKQTLQQTKKQLTTVAIRNALTKKNYQKVADLVEIADETGVKKNLRSRAWDAVAQYWFKQGHNAESVIAFNAARVLNPKNEKIIKGCFDSINLFLTEYRSKFSPTDVEPLREQMDRILEFYKVEKMWDSPVIEIGKQIKRRITYIIRTAESEIETPATHKTELIVKALRDNVSYEEVKADYARIIAPIFRELLAEEIEAEKEAAKKKSKKKSPSKESEPSESQDNKKN